MSAPATQPTDLLAQKGAAPKSVKERIERRLEVLREWLREGIPPGKAIPSSLTVAREWDDEELGIQRISSPNEFTKTHPQYRQQVSDVAGLLTALRKRYSRQVTNSVKPKSNPADKFDKSEHERQLATAVSQWHAERAQRIHEKNRADAADARSLALLDENNKMEKLIADLRRQLAKHKGLKVVE